MISDFINKYINFHVNIKILKVLSFSYVSGEICCVTSFKSNVSEREIIVCLSEESFQNIGRQIVHSPSKVFYTEALTLLVVLMGWFFSVK